MAILPESTRSSAAPATVRGPRLQPLTIAHADDLLALPEAVHAIVPAPFGMFFSRACDFCVRLWVALQRYVFFCLFF